MVSVAAANLMQLTRYATRQPIWRLHLAHAFLAALIALFSVMVARPLYMSMIVLEIVGGLALALCSRFPWPGTLLGSTMVWADTLMMTDASISPGIIPWLCTAVLVARDFPRMPACSLVVFSLVFSIADARWGEVSEGWVLLLVWWVMVGGGVITLAELVRNPCDRAERSLHAYRESMECQRPPVITELHDTVVRDLAHTVMMAEQVRLAYPQDAALAPQLDVMMTVVHAAVEQMWCAPRAMSDTRGSEQLDIEATSASCSLGAAIADAAAILGQRGARLEVKGLELLGILVILPDMRLQLPWVLGELAPNMSKYMAPQGRARLVIESDRRSLGVMANNDIDLSGQVSGAWAGAGTPGSGIPGHDALSSGLDLEGARRRVEALDGSPSVSQDKGRWATVFNVPSQAVS